MKILALTGELNAGKDEQKYKGKGLHFKPQMKHMSRWKIHEKSQSQEVVIGEIHG